MKKEKQKYRPITHFSVAIVECPYCRSIIGYPCRKWSDEDMNYVYTQTHLARAKKVLEIL